MLLLDVDGVLNPYGPDCPPGFVEHALFPDEDEPVRLCAVHGEWIAELAGAYDVVWATGWCELGTGPRGGPVALRCGRDGSGQAERAGSGS
jgi:hypothetical protein